MIRHAIQRVARQWGVAPRWPLLRSNALEVRDLECLKRAMGWTSDPLLEGEHLHEFRNLTDLNERKLRDAEVIGSACCNGDPRIVLEIGTAYGHGTALMARNAAGAIVYTVNLPPEQVAEGGRRITVAPAREEIGVHYLRSGCSNVEQVLANTRTWEPDFGPIDVALIDGCHDADFVYHDTRKVLARCREGSLILWHDFHPDLTHTYPWIGEVASGIERLYRDSLIAGPILHLADSWVGLYRVPAR